MEKVKDIRLGIGLKACIPSVRKIYVFCALIPFILFWAGVLSPLWTDNFVVYALALAPYYLYVYYVSNDWIDKKLFMTDEGLQASRIWKNCVILCSVFSILAMFLLTSMWGTVLGYPCLMLVLNAPMAAVSIFYANAANGFRYARPLPYFIA